MSGQPCAALGQCDGFKGYECLTAAGDAPTAVSPGTCVPRRAPGAACTDSFQCLANACGADDTCAPLLPKGAACDFFIECASGDCADGNKCT